MQIRLIEKGTPGLPAHISVVEGDTVEKGIANIVEACAGAAAPDLVVWNDAENLLSESQWNRLRDIFQSHFEKAAQINNGDYLERYTAYERPSNPDSLGAPLRKQFANVSHILGLPDDPALAALADSTARIVQELDKTFRLTGFKSGLRFETIRRAPFFHQHNYPANKGLLLRSLLLEGTVIADNGDLARAQAQGYKQGPKPPPGDFLWAMKPRALGLMLGDKSGKCPLHTAPDGLISPPGAKRVVQLMDVIASRSIVSPGP